jgi:hypothetical protein
MLWFDIFASMILPCCAPCQAVPRGSFANPFAIYLACHASKTMFTRLGGGKRDEDGLPLNPEHPCNKVF